MDLIFKAADDVADLLDSSLYLEDTHFKQGYAEGYDNGVTAGLEEAREVGLKVGFEAGEELGFYRGCLDVWNSVIRLDPSQFSSRVQKSLKTMEFLLEKYPFTNPEDENIQDIMFDLRLKFRAISATLGVKLEYTGYPKGGEDKNSEFW
ncbi:hypothetical protein SAY86_023484 [Trapa natans]|uniref:Essential protein Yae1 N-terminal domain-containing protein n=1 Tax=Trapa natans TaxID=22666 RepID=A0AAN7LXD3_TRANT|nr:hypothetical protein SAY86_023484 [Trapa natans]